MIKSDAISLAAEIVQAQKDAKIENVFEGVLVCTDVLKGLYKFIPYKNINLYDDVTLGAWVSKQDENVLSHQQQLSQLNIELVLAKEKIDRLEEDLLKLKQYVETQGDPLTSEQTL